MRSIDFLYCFFLRFLNKKREGKTQSEEKRMRYSNATAHRKTPALVKADLLALSKVVNSPFTEKDILDLQDDFLSNGFHYLKVNDIKTGRRVIHTFLHSLKSYYHDIGCLSVADVYLPDAITDIYEILEWYGYLKENYLENFFIDQWYFDFLWIEATEELLLTSWFCTFSQLVEDFSFNKEIPIFIISYY